MQQKGGDRNRDDKNKGGDRNRDGRNNRRNDREKRPVEEITDEEM